MSLVFHKHSSGTRYYEPVQWIEGYLVAISENSSTTYIIDSCLLCVYANIIAPNS